MELKEVAFTVDGVEQKFNCETSFEVFSLGNGKTISKFSSGKSVETEGTNETHWTHKKSFNADGSFESESIQTFTPEGRIESKTVEYADGSKDFERFSYDQNGYVERQKCETFKADGNGKVLYDRRYKNYCNGETFDKKQLDLTEDIVYRQYDSSGNCVHCIDPIFEIVSCINGKTIKRSLLKNGKLIETSEEYTSDDGQVTVIVSMNAETEKADCIITDLRGAADKSLIRTSYKNCKKIEG